MPIALCKKATGNDLFVYKACACRLVATAIRDCHGQRHICKRVLSHRLRLEFVALTGPATSDMGTEHAVGESVVVPGLKLIDHTFQVLQSTCFVFHVIGNLTAGSLAVSARLLRVQCFAPAYS